MENIELLIRKNCIYCLKPILKKSIEHIIIKSIGGRLIFPLTCGECNTSLGSVVDRHWSWDCWMKFAKDKLDLQKFNFRSELRVSDWENRYTVVKLPNGKEELKPPFTPDGAWRAVTKMAYELGAMMIGNYIFHSDFDRVRDFIVKGEFPAGHRHGSDSIFFGEWRSIIRTSYNQKEYELPHILPF